MKTITLLSILILTSCASTAFFKHKTKSTQDFAHDATECDVKFGQSNINHYYQQDWFERCLMGEGWEKQ